MSRCVDSSGNVVYNFQIYISNMSTARKN